MKKTLNISIIAIMMLLLFTQCKNDKKKYNKETKASAKVLKHPDYSFDNPPQFRKDCELFFIKKATAKTIFKIDTEIASTDTERARGLMFRPEMLEYNGMLFLMDYEELHSFYMRNTIIPLDIIYVNSKFEIVDIYKNTNVLDETSLPSAVPAKYVIEINAGLCDVYNIEIGDFINFQ